jgi:hypothetical protein
METNIAHALLEEYRDFEGARLPVDVEGMSSPRVCSFLNQLVARMDPGEQYLEIGTWKGRTLLSAALGNSGRVCIGCDHFRFWGRFTGPGFLARRELYRNIERYRRQIGEVRFHEMRSQKLFAQGAIKGSVGVYFYDGDHTERGTYSSVVSVAPLLSRRAVLLMDDWNDPVIRDATLRGLEDAGLTALWGRDLPGTRSPDDWWNGLGVFYVERADQQLS